MSQALETGLGIHRASGHRYVYAPNNTPSDFTIIEDHATAFQEKKASIFTFVNADSSLSTDLSFEIFRERLKENRSLLQTEEGLLKLLKDSVVEKESLPFTAVAEKHLTALGLDFSYDLKLDDNDVRAFNEPTSIPMSNLHRESIKNLWNHFNISRESSRWVIGEYLVTAVVYAQKQIDSNETLRSDLFDTYGIENPHVAVSANVRIPCTRITCNENSYVFHGALDFGVGFIKAGDVDTLASGALKLDVSGVQCGIFRAKSLDEMQDAIPQIRVQVLTVLALSQRKTFTCALTNGTLWRFFTAYDGGDQLRIYTSSEYAIETDSGVIMELLKDMILYTVSPMVTTDFTEMLPAHGG